MRCMARNIIRASVLVCLAITPLPAVAGSVTFSFSNGARSASAEFDSSGNNLVVTLTNTSSADAQAPIDILTGIYFDLASDPLLTRISAVIPTGSAVLLDGTGADVTPTDRIVGGEWAYLNNLTLLASANAGISSSGFGIFGPHDLFPGPNLQGPTSPGGLEFGIAPAGDNLLTGNGGLAGRDLIQNSVVFTLGGFTGEPDALIHHAVFQYGTALDEPHFTVIVPEPSSWVLLVLGLTGLACYGWRRHAS